MLPPLMDPNSKRPSKTEPARWEINDGLNGRRLALAEWIANDKNPLTARSIVNRIWQYHFGKGIVKTANNFGAKGSKPTHPELLDWLTNGLCPKRLENQTTSPDDHDQQGLPPVHQNRPIRAINRPSMPRTNCLHHSHPVV